MEGRFCEFSGAYDIAFEDRCDAGEAMAGDGSDARMIDVRFGQAGHRGVAQVHELDLGD